VFVGIACAGTRSATLIAAGLRLETLTATQTLEDAFLDLLAAPVAVSEVGS